MFSLDARVISTYFAPYSKIKQDVSESRSAVEGYISHGSVAAPHRGVHTVGQLTM